jgi:sugar phosphate isomerase/epimerase
MMESMYKYMKVGIIHFMAYPVLNGEGPVVETLQKIAEDDYFNAVEISWIKDPAAKAEAKKILKTSHMTVGYGAQPRLLTTGFDINSLDEDMRQKALATLKEGIDEAYEMGASGFAFLSGKYPGDDKKDAAMEALIKSTVELCNYAKSKGDMRVELEVFDRDIEKRSLIGPAADARAFAEAMSKRCDNFGLLVDLSHIPQLNESAEQALLPVKDYLTHAHLGNCVVKDKTHPAYGDKHPRFGIEGGENDVDETVAFLKVLLDIGFLNPGNPPVVSFEVKPVGDECPELVIANAKRVLTEAWAKL